MTYGPIDFLALEFKGNQFKGEGLASLLDLVERQIIRIIDLVVIMKDEDGEVGVRELQQLDPHTVGVFNPLQAKVTGMITTQDIEMVGQALDNNCSAAIMLYENLWAITFKEAVLRADARVLMQERIPYEVVEEALAEMEELGEEAMAIEAE